MVRAAASERCGFVPFLFERFAGQVTIMRALVIALALAALVPRAATAQDFAPAPPGVPQIEGADLFIDYEQYVGKPVVLVNGVVHSPADDSVLVQADHVTFWVPAEGI